MAAVLSLLVLTFLAMLGGAYVLWRRGGPKKQIVLMLILALVVAINIGIWTLPGSSGDAPYQQLD